MIYLGYLEKGDDVRITNSDKEDDTRKISVDVYRMNRNALIKALDLLGEEHLEQVSYDSRQITGRLSLSKAGRLILSVPYERGWSVMIDGEKTEPRQFGGALMAFDLEAGEHEIEMQYEAFGKKQGFIVSLVAMLEFGFIVWYRLKQSRKEAENPEKPENPEKLLKTSV